MGFGSKLKKTLKRAEGQTRDQIKRAKDPERGIWGDSPYARYAERLTGVSTFKSAVYRHTGGELDGDIKVQSNPYESAKHDARLGRPTLAYQDEMVHRPEAEIAAKAAAKATEHQQREQRRARNAMAVRVRRAGRSDRPTTHGGTLVTGALGLPGTATPERGTKLGM